MDKPLSGLPLLLWLALWGFIGAGLYNIFGLFRGFGIGVLSLILVVITHDVFRYFSSQESIIFREDIPTKSELIGTFLGVLLYHILTITLSATSLILLGLGDSLAVQELSVLLVVSWIVGLK